jgi:4-nitrophenyl phosphatase
MDGTLYHGRTPIQYAKEFILYLQRNHRRFMLVTNCPGSNSEELALKLEQMGISIVAENILTSGQVTAEYLAENKAQKRVYVIGSKALKRELVEKGLEIVSTKPDYVVVGFDKNFHYGKMKRAVGYILEGAKFIVTNQDATIQEGDAIIPHTGAIAAGIEQATGVKPLSMGKPKKFMLDVVIKKFGCSKEECCIIGDRIDTDIALGSNFGITTYLVMTGVTGQELLKNSELKPDRVFANLQEVMEFDVSIINK